MNEGRPNAVDLLKAGSLQLIIYTTTSGAHRFTDEKAIRRNAVTVPRPLHHHHERRQGRRRSHCPASRDPIRVWSLQEIHS